MNWKQLLNTTRHRDLVRGAQAQSEPNDFRSAFDRDYGRAVFSTTVRRLQDKAQVFPLEPHDSVRTRLTHSLEVSTIARSIVAAVSPTIVKRDGLQAEDLRAIEAIAATCGLLHDIGNPPFGHSGEEAIRSWFQEWCKARPKDAAALNQLSEQAYSDFARFEGNAQTLRLVSRLQLLADSYGLNLTVGTLSALMKYVAPSDKVQSKKQPGSRRDRAKPGFFWSEKDLVRSIDECVGTEGARNPIAYLVEAADDICYSTVDLEDAIKKGVIGWADISDAVREHDEKLIQSCEEYVAARGLSRDNARYEEVLVQYFRTEAMISHVLAVRSQFEESYDAIMAGSFAGDLLSSGVTSKVLKACKELAEQKVYPEPQILRLEVAGGRVIRGLLDIFWRAAEAAPHEKAKELPGKLYRLLSPNYREAFERDIEGKAGGELVYAKLQLVTDYVCGMTDSFALSLYGELEGM